MTDERNNDFDNWLNKKPKEDINEKETLEHDIIVSGVQKNVEDNFKDTQKSENPFLGFVDKEYVDEQIKKNKPKNSFLKAFSLVVAGSIVGGFISPYANSYLSNSSNNSSSVNVPAINISTTKEQGTENAVAKKAIPSVVGVRANYTGQSIFGSAVSGEDIGSGVVVSKDGYILTNSHVVGKNANSISVLFSDNSTTDAKIIWQDSTLDLAIIKVDKDNLTPAEFGDSDKVEIGDKAIAIGNPLGLNLQSTLTSGYISGLDRSISVKGGNVMNGLIQTDASINSGNSGGALLNSRGQLIGINTAKAGNTDGIGFAIPVNIAKKIVESVVENGNYSSVTLGIRGMNVLNYKQIYLAKDIEDDKGIFISEVVKGTSAEKAGLHVKDILVAINGEEVESMNKLKQVLLKYKPGDTIKLTVHRDNKNVELDLTFTPNSPDA